MNNFKIQKLKSNRAFTVLETMVAIMVASLAIVGATTAARGGIQAGSIAKEEVRAFYLAQEVLEIVNNKRDSNELANVVNGTSIDWRTNIYDPSGTGLCSIGNKCYLDLWNVAGPTFLPCSGSCPVLRQNKNDARYGYGAPSDWKATPYTMTITMEKDSSSDSGLLVNINIAWNHAGSPYNFNTKTLITNWFTSSSSE